MFAIRDLAFQFCSRIIRFILLSSMQRIDLSTLVSAPPRDLYIRLDLNLIAAPICDCNSVAQLGGT